MERKTSKYIASSLLLAISVGIPTPVYAASMKSIENKLEMNLDKIEELDGQRNETKHEIDGLNVEISKLVSEMNELTSKLKESNRSLIKLESELSSLNSEINELDSEIVILKEEIKITKDKIATKEAEVEKNQAFLEARVREAYKSNSLSQIISALLSSQSLSEFYDRFTFIKYMAEEDKRTIDTINAIVVELDLEKEHLELQNQEFEVAIKDLNMKKSSTERLVKEVEMKKRELQDSIDEIQLVESKKRDAYLNLSHKEQKIAQEIGDIQDENEELEKEIQRIIIEEQRKAEEKRKQEEEARKKEEAENNTPAESESENQNTGYLRPVSGRITSPFGYRIHPIWNDKRFHNGIDYAGSMGTPVKSTKAGTVIVSQYKPSYGNVVIVDHGNGISSLYAHLNSFAVSVGQKVDKGQSVGGLGSTGDSTGPHLHFEIRLNGKPQNPASYVN